MAERRTPTSRSGLSRESALMYLPAKFKIRFLQRVDLTRYSPDDADDVALVQGLAEEIRGRIQAELDDMQVARRSVWFG